MIKIYGAKDYITMPWKNGQGFTSQLLIEPGTAQFPEGPFTWRLSSALILSSGEFSRFPGYDRWLMLTSGNSLKIGDAFLKRNDSLRFSGDNTQSIDLVDGPVQDLGLIYDRKKVTAEMVIRINEASALTMDAGSGEHTLLIYCFEESLQVLSQNILSGELARIDDEKGLISIEPNPKSKWIEIRITSLPETS
jgi:environmental stress-induced protein Ves